VRFLLDLGFHVALDGDAAETLEAQAQTFAERFNAMVAAVKATVASQTAEVLAQTEQQR
jgi:hypothetical protein